MNNNNKVVPVLELREYVKNLLAHQKTLTSWLEQLDQGDMPADFVQQLCTKPLVNFQAIVKKIVKDNNLVSVSDKQDDEKMVGVIKHMVKMQTQLSVFSSG